MFSFQTQAAGTGDTRWITDGTFGIFLHYQYRILLGYSVATKPQFPSPSQMTAAGWNRFVDGFDVKGFAEQMAEVRVGWVLFCGSKRLHEGAQGFRWIVGWGWATWRIEQENTAVG